MDASRVARNIKLPRRVLFRHPRTGKGDASSRCDSFFFFLLFTPHLEVMQGTAWVKSHKSRGDQCMGCVGTVIGYRSHRIQIPQWVGPDTDPTGYRSHNGLEKTRIQIPLIQIPQSQISGWDSYPETYPMGSVSTTHQTSRVRIAVWERWSGYRSHKFTTPPIAFGYRSHNFATPPYVFGYRSHTTEELQTADTQGFDV